MFETRITPHLWPCAVRLAAACGLLTAFQLATAATLCVNPGASSGCYATIGAAVSAANAGDTINISSGSYAETITIGKSLSLVGAGAGATIINAKGQSNGIHIDGLGNAALTGVLVTGVTVMNANYEGILVTNSSYLTISENHVTANNQSLNTANGTCPGLPVFETNEALDCGEGIHLMGVDHATVAGNTVDLNSGGILITDETGQSHDNLITSNIVRDNPYACGITLASHPVSPQASSTSPYGVFNNTIANNDSSSNGLGAAGDGAGVGIFAPGPGNLNFGNRVIGNTLRNNGLPGVTIHNHAAPTGAPQIDLNDTVIEGNTISGNAADTADAATPGTAGINIYSQTGVWGTIIAANNITDEADAVVLNTVGGFEVHFNNLAAGTYGIINLGHAVVNGALNYWGCAGGPGTTGCSAVNGPSVAVSPRNLLKNSFDDRRWRFFG